MESKKVKEIKKALECCRHSIKGGCKDCPYHNPNEDCQEFLIWNMEDYINELEKDNERLRSAKVVYETVDYCAEDLRKAQYRIVELEKENAVKTNTITDLLKKQEFYEKKKIKQFAERLKEKLDEQKHFYEIASISHRDISLVALNTAYKYLDQTLKEFLDGE